MRTSGHYLFHEEQSFRQSWVIYPLVGIVLGVIVLHCYGLYQQLYLGKPWGENTASDTELIFSSVISTVVVLAVVVLLLKLTLETEVRDDGFYYRFPILINRERCIHKNDISRYEVGKYHPIGEFGGWGIRVRLGKRRAYNIKGNQGVKFYLKNGKMVLFGTQQPSELRKALDKMMQPSNL